MHTEQHITKKQLSIKNNLWVIWSFIGSAFISLLYVGIKSKNYKWVGIGFVHLACISIVLSGLEQNDSSTFWNLLYFIIWIGFVIYVLRIREEYQDHKLTEDSDNVAKLKTEKKEQRKKESLDLWAAKFPEHHQEVDSQYNIINGILSLLMIAADGQIKESEKEFINNELPKSLGYDDQQIKEFTHGSIYATKNKITMRDCDKLFFTLNDTTKNNKIIDTLISISAVDGFIDKAEYNLIKRISYICGKSLPDFEELAVFHDAKTSDIEGDKRAERREQEEQEKAKRALSQAVSAEKKQSANPSKTQNNRRKSSSTFAKSVAIGTGMVAASTVKASLKSSKPKTQTPSPVDRKRSVCVTCQHWAGERKTKFSATQVQYKSSKDRAECTIKAINRQKKLPLDKCPKWHKWSALK